MKQIIIRHARTDPLALRPGAFALADKSPRARQNLLAILETTAPEELAKVWPSLAGHSCDRLWAVWRDRRTTNNTNLSKVGKISNV
jgi:hypothetical protein